MIISGDDSAFDALVYGQPHPNTLRFLEQTYQNVSQATSGFANEFIQRSRDLFDHYHGAEAIRRAKTVLAQVKTVFRADIVMPLETVTDFQSAQFLNRRFIMADPWIRQRYHDQRIEGWDKRYTDMQPNSIGDAHLDYQRVYDGIIQVDEDGYAFCNQYPEIRDVDGETELDHSDQVTSIKNALRMRVIIEAGKDDPTSVWGSML